MFDCVMRSSTPGQAAACSALYSAIFSGRMPMTMPMRCIAFPVLSVAGKAASPHESGAGLAVVGARAGRLRCGLRHVFALLCLAVVLRSRAVVDLRAGVDPDLARTTASGRRG